MEEVIVEVEFADGNYSARVPLLLDWIAVRSSVKEKENFMEELIPFHLEELKNRRSEILVILNGHYCLV